MNTNPKICLTVAGLDPSGGAGIIADIKTFTALDCFATAAVTSLTFQNTCGVFGSVSQTAETVRGQILPVVEDYEIAAVKTGMLPTREIIEEIARIVEENNLKNLVVDPVIRSTSGFDLIGESALRALIEKLFPLAAIITPNLPEAGRISKTEIENEADIGRAARIMQSFGAKNVLIKGGHKLSENSKFARDYLFAENDLHVFESEYIETTSTHGTGCTLAAAIAANLALGKSLVEAVGLSKKFVTEAIRSAPKIGKGNSPVNHSVKIPNFRFQIPD